MNNFITGYDFFKKTKLLCKPIKEWIKVDKYVSGSGGSNNLIIIGKINKMEIIIKLIPRVKKFNNEKAAKNNDQLEIVFYKYFSKKYLLNNITPHIVGIYSSQDCPNIHKMFDDKYSTLKCPTLKKIIYENIKRNNVCKFIHTINDDIADDSFDMCLLEYCPLTIDGEMEKLFKNLMNKKINFSVIEDFIYRTNFQIIYTIACLQHKDKYFTHNDLFLRNILGVNESSYNQNDFVEYQIFNKKFYLPANGFYSKINDFGMTVIYPTIKPNFITEDIGVRRNWKKDDDKSDIYNYLYDFYDGNNLGSKSTMKILDELEIKSKYVREIREIFNSFIKTNEIDKMNKSNKNTLAWTRNISGHEFLEKLIKTPKEYLLSNVFKRYSKLPKGGNVVNVYKC